MHTGTQTHTHSHNSHNSHNSHILTILLFLSFSLFVFGYVCGPACVCVIWLFLLSCCLFLGDLLVSLKYNPPHSIFPWMHTVIAAVLCSNRDIFGLCKSRAKFLLSACWWNEYDTALHTINIPRTTFTLLQTDTHAHTHKKKQTDTNISVTMRW